MTFPHQEPSPRLLAINNYFYRRGGAESVFLDHMSLFRGIGWDVIPFAMHHPSNLDSPWSDYFVSEIEYGRQPGLRTKLSHAASIIYSREAKRNIRALIDRAPPAIAHAHNVYHHLSPSIFPVLKKAGIPTVMTVHDLKLACPAYKMLSGGHVCEKCRNGRIHNVVVNRCVKDSAALSGLVFVETLVHRLLGLYRDAVDRFVVPSRFYREKLIEWGWPEDKLVYIPNFVDIDHFASDWVEGDYFAYAGRLAPEKGLLTLIRAVALAGQKLVIAGTGPEAEKLKRFAATCGAQVTFAGYVSGDALFRLIGQSRALVLPSEWYENAPISVLEAYALGRPVIGARIGGIPELIVDGETGMTFQPGDADDLARALGRMAAVSSAERKRTGAAARNWISGEFSSSAYRQRILQLYTQLDCKKTG